MINENGDPVAGATVAVKGTKNATATTGEGEFILRNIDPNAMLILTATNILSIEEKVDRDKDIVLRIKGKTSILDQVQVIAYGTTSQRFNTRNVGTVKAGDIEKQPVNNPLFALQGCVPGFLIGKADGNPLSYINPSDIESIGILKDADATAIYGSRGANGAILNTPKPGKILHKQIDLNMQCGWGKTPDRLHLLHT